MQLEEIIRLHKEAPSFVRQYEMKKLTLSSQALLLECKRGHPDEYQLLTGWINTNQAWLTTHQEKYFLCQKFAALTLDDLFNLYSSKPNKET